MTTNPLLAFLKETILRFSAKSPLFFKIWSTISLILVLVTGVPDLLRLFEFTIPELFAPHIDRAVGWASRGLFVMSMLATQSTPIGVDESGNPLKKTNEKKLPFTDMQEKKQIVKKETTVNQLAVVDVVPTTDVIHTDKN